MHGQLPNGSCLRYGDRGSRLLSPKFESFDGGRTVGQIAGNGGQVVVAGKEDVFGSVMVGIDIVGDLLDFDGIVVVNEISDGGTDDVNGIMVNGISEVDSEGISLDVSGCSDVEVKFGDGKVKKVKPVDGT